MLGENTISDTLKQLQGNLRIKILEMYNKANAGHIGCSLSCIDLLIAIILYCKKEEDFFILSKGHAAAALYACLNYKGEITDDVLETFYKEGTKLPAHPAPNKFKSIPFATGSLGHGLPISVGIAKANKMNGKNDIAYVLMSDGETNEGTTWEASHFAVKHNLNNLIVIIDKNRIQGFGNTKDILGDTASKDKWEAIGFEIKETNGHDIQEIICAITELKTSTNAKPKLLIANTIKGKGVSFMENKMEWHYLPLNKELYEKAMNEIKANYNA